MAKKTKDEQIALLAMRVTDLWTESGGTYEDDRFQISNLGQVGRFMGAAMEMLGGSAGDDGKGPHAHCFERWNLEEIDNRTATEYAEWLYKDGVRP